MNLAVDRQQASGVSGNRRQLLFLLILSILLFHVWYLRALTEDAFISFRYARNLSNGYGLVWNPGWTPVEGYTNFLWVILLSAMFKTGMPLERSSQVAGVIFAVATMFLVFRSSGRKLLPVLFLALCGPFAAWASSGLETSLFTFLIFAGVILHLRERESKTFPFSGSLFFLAALARPEGLLVFVIVFSHLVYSNSRERLRITARRSFEMLLAFAIPFSIYFFWRYHYYGFLLPNTFYAKVGSTISQILRGLKYALEFYGLMVFPIAAAVRPFLARLDYRSRLSLWLVYVYTAYIVAVGGDYMAFFRFFVPLTPFLAWIAAETVELLFARLPLRNAAYQRPAVALLCFICLLPSLPLENLRSYLPGVRYYWNARYDTRPRLLFERWQVGRLTEIGKWMKSRLPEGSTVAYVGVGAIGWYAAQANILDMSGLNDIHIAHKQMREMGKGLAGHEKEDWLYVLSMKPDYILGSRFLEENNRPQTFAQLYEGKLEAYSREEQSLILKDLAAHYEMQFHPFTDAANHETGYLVLLHRKAS